MISSSGRYWSTGITLHWQENSARIEDELFSGWYASLDYRDDGFADNDSETGRISTEGTLHTRYAVLDSKTRTGLSLAIDTLLTDAERLGIDFSHVTVGPFLYYKGDGEDPDHVPPADWRNMLAAEAERIGWPSAYTKED